MTAQKGPAEALFSHREVKRGRCAGLFSLPSEQKGRSEGLFSQTAVKRGRTTAFREAAEVSHCRIAEASEELPTIGFGNKYLQVWGVEA